MSNFDRFRNFQTAGLVQAGAKQKEFLTRSKSSRTVLHLPANEHITAVLTNSYKEGGDEFVMFTEYLVNEQDNVIIGDYIEYDEKTYLVYNEYNHPMKQLWLKHQLIECNQVISFSAVEQPVYYISSLRRFINNNIDSIGKSLIISSGSKPLIITSDSERLFTGLRFAIAGEMFSIVEIDKLSNPGIAYISIERASIMSQDDLNIGTAYEPIESNDITDGQEGIPGIGEHQLSGGRIMAGSLITETTYLGYIEFDRAIKIISRTATEVVWQAPMKESLIKVTVQDSNLERTEIFYKVVI